MPGLDGVQRKLDREESPIAHSLHRWTESARSTVPKLCPISRYRALALCCDSKSLKNQEGITPEYVANAAGLHLSPVRLPVSPPGLFRVNEC